MIRLITVADNRQRQAAARASLLCIVAVSVLVLTGCGADKAEPIKLTGELRIVPSMPMPSDNSAQVSVIERDGNGAEKRIVAERSLHDLDKRPITFEIEVDRKLIDAQGGYVLQAKIVDANGKTRWKTQTNAPVQLRGQDKPLELTLTRIARRRRAPTFDRYRCDDGFNMAVAITGKRAVVRLNKRRLGFTRIEAGQVQRFEDDHDNRLRLEDDRITLHIDGGDHEKCTAVGAASASGPER